MNKSQKNHYLQVDDDGTVTYMLDETSQFVQDLKKFQEGQDGLTFNGKPMPSAYWNLICSIRDVSWYLKGMKPTRSWKITPVKKYFGFRGHDNKIFLDYLQAIQQELVNKKQEDGAN
jgi:hypothetical protein